MMNTEGKTVIYKSYDNLYDAMYAKDILKANGIESFISDDSMLPLNPIVSGKSWGTKLHIFEKDIALVENILKEIKN